MTTPKPNSGTTTWYPWVDQTDLWARNPQENPLGEVRTSKLLWSRGERVTAAAATEVNMLNISGPGNVESVWMATPGPVPSLDARIRIYYDGSGTPAMDMDLGTLLAAHYGSNGPWHMTPHMKFQIQLPSYNASWQTTYSMPFGTSIRIAYYLPVAAASADIYWQIAYSLYTTDRANGQRLRGVGTRLPDATTLAAASAATLINATGTGAGALIFHSYIGGYDSAITTNMTWLERNFSVFVDSESTASIIATGTEDWFDSGWYYDGIKDYLASPHAYVATDQPAAPNQYAVGQAVDFLSKWGGIPFTSAIKMTLDTEAACTTAHKYGYCLLYYSVS